MATTATCHPLERVELVAQMAALAVRRETREHTSVMAAVAAHTAAAMARMQPQRQPVELHRFTAAVVVEQAKKHKKMALQPMVVMAIKVLSIC